MVLVGSDVIERDEIQRLDLHVGRQGHLENQRGRQHCKKNYLVQQRSLKDREGIRGRLLETGPFILVVMNID